MSDDVAKPDERFILRLEPGSFVMRIQRGDRISVQVLRHGESRILVIESDFPVSFLAVREKDAEGEEL